MKCYLLDMVRLMHSGAHNDCGYLHMTVRDQASQYCSTDVVDDLQAYPRLSSYWQWVVPREGQSFFIEDMTTGRFSCSSG